MADSKITDLTELTSVADTDILPVVDDPSGTAVTKKITKANLVSGLLANVVEDTTPQLGGDLDMNSNNITAAGPTTISPTEVSYLDGVTSNLQTQLNAKGTLNNIVEDTTPQLGGDLDLNSNNITNNTDFKYDTTNKRLSIGTTDNTVSVGGSTAIGAKIFTETEGATDLVDYYAHRHSDTAGFGAHLMTGRTRGTHASQTIVQSGDTLNRIMALGYDGAQLELAASIEMEVDGTPGTDDMPGRIVFKTTPDGSNTLAEAMRISQDKSVSLKGNLDLAASTNLSVNSTNILADSAGTMTLSNIDALDATTEATIESAIDTLSNLTTVGTVTSGNVDAVVSAASDTTAGKVELATAAETTTGTDTGRAVTPDGLAGSIFGKRSVQMTVVDFTTDVATGDGKFYFHVPAPLAGMNIVAVHAEVITAGTTGTTDIQLHNVTDAVDILSTVITIDSAETGSDTAATPAVINTANDDLAENDLIRVDVDAVSTTAPKGLIVTFDCQLP